MSSGNSLDNIADKLWSTAELEEREKKRRESWDEFYHPKEFVGSKLEKLMDYGLDHFEIEEGCDYE